MRSLLRRVCENLKRKAESVRPRESTENRVTAALVISPASVTSLPVERSSSGPEGNSLKTTLLGMPTPTPAPAAPCRRRPRSRLDVARRGARARDHRQSRARYRSLASAQLPRALPPRWPALSPDAALGEASTEIQWPQERAPMLSDGPQVRSLPVVAVPRHKFRPVTLGAAGAALAATLAISIATLRHSAAPHASIESGAARASEGAVMAPPSAKPLAAFTAPAPIPPVLEEPAAPSSRQAAATPSDAPLPSHARVVSVAPKPRAVHPTSPAPHAFERPNLNSKGRASRSRGCTIEVQTHLRATAVSPSSLGLWLAVTLAAGCHTSTLGSPTPVTTTANVGPAGGHVAANGAVLDVPAGAPVRAHDDHHHKDPDGPPAPYIPFSPLFRFSPDGLTFAKPATVSFSTSSPSPDGHVYWTLANGGGYGKR